MRGLWRLEGYVAEARTYGSCLIGPRYNPRIRFVVFGAGRSGSTLLVDLLDSHPDVRCELEILQRRVALPSAYVGCRASLCPCVAYGFKLLTYHVQHVHRGLDGAAFLRDLVSSGFGILHLRRMNLLRLALSNMYAPYTGVWTQRTSWKGAAELPKMQVDMDELDHWLNRCKRAAEIELSYLGDLPRLEFVYEDDLEHAGYLQGTASRAYEYIGVGPATARTDLLRETTPELSGFVSNYDELGRGLRGTRYEQYLED